MDSVYQHPSIVARVAVAVNPDTVAGLDRGGDTQRVERTGSLALGLAVGTALSASVAAVLLTQSVEISLKNVISSEEEQVLVNYAKKKAALLAVTTPSPCDGTVAATGFTAEPTSSPDAGIQSRCFKSGSEKILQACKVCTPGQAGYQVVTVQLPGGACGGSDANWVAYTYDGYENSYIYLSPWPAVEWQVGSRKLYTLDSQRVFTGGLAAFQSDPVRKILETPDLPRGVGRNERLVFDVAQLMVESASTQSSFLDALAAGSTSSALIKNQFLCSRNRAGDSTCHCNNCGAWMGALSSASADGPYFVSHTDNNLSVGFLPRYKEIGKYCACTKLTDLHQNFDYVESRMAPYLTQPGNMNLAANELPIPELNLSQTTLSTQEWQTFPDDAVWDMVRQARILPASVELLHWKRSADYLATANGSIRRVYTFTVKFSDGHIEEVLTGTEHNNGGVGRKIYLVGNTYVLQTSGCSSAGYALEPLVFDFTGAMQSYRIPSGLTSVRVKVWGAGGGGSYPGDCGATNTGGGGGYSDATLTVTAGEVLNLLVGGGGLGGACTSSGGGRSAVARAGTEIVIAGGGGGGACLAGANGGAGGGLNGQDGQLPVGASHRGGYGGSQFSGGNGGIGAWTSRPGVSGVGGTCESGAIQGGYGGGGGGNVSNGWSCGGGGGGYFGGGSGNTMDNHAGSCNISEGPYGPGGGGSGKVPAGGTTVAGNLSVPGQASDPARGSAGNGGTISIHSGNGGNGRVVLEFP